MNCDIENLTARVYYSLKGLLTVGDTLAPRSLEKVVCDAFRLKHVGDGNYYADGVDTVGQPSVQVSVKTRMLRPVILKNSGRDFSTHPGMFLGPQQNKKHNKEWAGLEFVQRRQEIVNEQNLSPRQIGRRSMVRFLRNIKESKEKFCVDKTYEVILIHGYNWQETEYLVNVYWQEVKLPALNAVQWAQTPGGVDGLINNQIVMHRVRGGAPRESTCFKEYKDPTKYTHSVSMSIPIPDPWEFDQQTILQEIQHLKETMHVSDLLQ